MRLRNNSSFVFVSVSEDATVFIKAINTLPPLSNLARNPLICHIQKARAMWVEVWVDMKNAPKGAYSLKYWRKRSPTTIIPINNFRTLKDQLNQLLNCKYSLLQLVKYH